MLNNKKFFKLVRGLLRKKVNDESIKTQEIR